MLDELFKAKSIADEEWITGYLYRISESQNPFIMPPDSKGTSYEVDPSTICRCTGKEYMDHEIAYEGDIFKSQSCGVIMVLKYGTYTAYCPADKCCMESVGFYAEAAGYPQMPIGDLSEYAIRLGNIFDNAETLDN